jgi:hypothetical protein
MKLIQEIIPNVTYVNSIEGQYWCFFSLTGYVYYLIDPLLGGIQMHITVTVPEQLCTFM